MTINARPVITSSREIIASATLLAEDVDRYLFIDPQGGRIVITLPQFIDAWNCIVEQISDGEVFFQSSDPIISPVSGVVDGYAWEWSGGAEVLGWMGASCILMQKNPGRWELIGRDLIPQEAVTLGRDNQTAYYSCDSFSAPGNLLPDLFGSNDLTPTNSPTVIPAKINNGLQLVEPSSQYLSLSGVNLFSGDFSVFFLFRINSSRVNTRQELFRQSDSNPNLGIVCHVNYNVGGIIRITISTNGTSQTIHSTTFIPTDDQWHSLAITYDGVNIVVTMDNLPPESFAQTGTIFYSGQAFELGAVSGIRYLYGDIDEFGIWSSVVSTLYLQSGRTLIGDLLL